MVVHCRQSRGFIYLPPFPSPCCVFLPLDSEPDGLDAEMAELASLGFTGCLSGVHFNSISPLKAALLHPDSPVIVTGPLVQSSCGSSSPANTYAAETTHSLSGTGSKVSLCMLSLCIYYWPALSHPPTFSWCGNLSGTPLILFLWLFIRLSYWLINHPPG